MTKRPWLLVASLAALAGASVLTDGPAAKPTYPPGPWPTQCHFLKNHGACVNCCKEAGFPDECGQFCSYPTPPIPPPPDQEPLP
jgi:hypothetical protein